MNAEQAIIFPSKRHRLLSKTIDEEPNSLNPRVSKLTVKIHLIYP